MDNPQTTTQKNHQVISYHCFKITKIVTNQLTAYIFQPQNKQYQLSDLGVLSQFAIGQILKKIHINNVNNEKTDSQSRIIAITLICEQHGKSIPNSMLNYGLIINTEVAAAQNLYTNIDVLSISYCNYSDRNKVFSFIHRMLQCSKSVAVLQGSKIKFNSITKTVEEGEKQTKDKYTLITGGSRGIGAKIALEYAKRGKNVIITGRPGNKQVAQYAISLQNKYNIKANALYLDIKYQASCSQLAKKISQMNNVILQNVILNGAVGHKTCEQQATQTVSAQQILIEVNAIGQVILFNKLQQHKLVNKNTLLMIVSSVIVPRPYIEMGQTYGCAKYMLQGWTEKIKGKYKTMVIYSGATETEMFAQSTLNPLKEKNKLEQFVNKLPKKFVIPPEVMGSIVCLYTDDEFKDHFNEARIMACCGSQLEYKEWPAGH